MIIYASRTGNVRYVTSKLSDIECIDIKNVKEVKQPYFIFTYTDMIGEIPHRVLAFLRENKQFLKGVIASGNVNFGTAYCLSADKISKEFGVPIIRKIDLRGNSSDITAIEQAYAQFIN